MSFDPRSLERLRQLGRQLPEAITAPATETKRAPKDSRPRHKVETEQDPSRSLIQTDGERVPSP